VSLFALHLVTLGKFRWSAFSFVFKSTNNPIVEMPLPVD
jgi:hypothetical protein